jgi:hypothetical protein
MSIKKIVIEDYNATSWAGVETDGSPIIVECVGGGAGGPKGNSGWVGAGGGEYARSTIPYISGTSVPIQVGRSAAGSTTSGLGHNGFDTSFNNGQILAHGGTNNRFGGTGGTGDVVYKGGDGAAGEQNYISGGGGAGGGIGPGGAGGSSRYYGGNGGGLGGYSDNFLYLTSLQGITYKLVGHGGNTDNVSIADGFAYGGAGSGGISINGGDGCQGVIIITYNTPGSKIHYAAEIKLNNSTLTDTDHGLVNGVFRFVTDRPQYDGHTVVPVYGPDEIDLSGLPISNNNNTHVYYQDFIVKDGIDGNAVRSIDITSGGSYGNDASFSFKLRGDKIIGSYFWEFCKNNNIILSNSIVVFYVVIDDVFWKQWQGRVSNNPYTDTDFEIQCKDDATTIHKVMPPFKEQVVKTNASGLISEQVINLNVNSNNSAPVIPGTNQTAEEITIPIVFGDVSFSPIIKINDQNTFEILDYDNESNPVYAIPAYQYRIISNATDNQLSQLYLLHSGAVKFTASDSRLKGKYLNAIVGQNVDKDQIYRIVDNTATTFPPVINPSSPAKFYMTMVTLDSLLVDSNKSIVTETNFNSNEGITSTIDWSKVNRYAYYAFSSATQAGEFGPHSSPNTWYFKVSTYAIETQVSTNNFLGNIDTSAQLVKGASGYSLWSWDSNSNSYIDVSSFVSVSSTGNTVSLTTNTATTDGKIQKIELINYPIELVCLRSTPGGGIGNAIRIVGTFGQLIANPLIPTNANPGTDFSYPSTIVPGIIYVDGHAQPGTSCKITDGNIFPLFIDHNRVNEVSFTLSLNNPVFAICVKYDLNQPLPYDYDRIYFLVDVNVSGGTGDCRIGALQYSLFDSRGLLSFPGLSYNPPAAITRCIANGNINLLPNDYYSGVPFTDVTSLFLNNSGVASKAANSSVAYNMLFDFNPTNLGNTPQTGALIQNTTKDDLTKSDYIRYIECQIPFNARTLFTALGIAGDANANWGNTFSVGIKEIALMGVRTIDTVSGDLFARVEGELTGADDTDPLQKTDDIYHTIMHIMEDYDGINKKLIDYGNIPQTRGSWEVGRVVTDQQNAINYLNEICSQSFIGLYGNRKGQRALNAWLGGPASPNATFTPTFDRGKSTLHNSLLIIEGSISNLEKTDFSQIYNSFQLSYNYDPGSKNYTRFINVSSVDATGGFPVPTNYLWHNYVTGAYGTTSITDNWSDASSVWTSCSQSYVDNHVTQLATVQASELPWFIDDGVFKDEPTNPVSSSAWKYLNFLAYWSTRQKDIVTYNIPITEFTVGTELLDCITFNDDIFTDGQDRVGWITSIEIDAASNQYVIQSVLQSSDLAKITTPDGLDERPPSVDYVDSLDQRSFNTDSLDER